MTLSGQGRCSEEGAKEIKPQTKTILESITALYSISYNPYLKKMVMSG